jgi:hypothetical protein
MALEPELEMGRDCPMATGFRGKGFLKEFLMARGFPPASGKGSQCQEGGWAQTAAELLAVGWERRAHR